MNRTKLLAFLTLLGFTTFVGGSACACVRHVHVKPGIYVWTG